LLDTKTFKILSFPNKSISLKNSGFIFRSDSNTEDLDGFAGAGLFDSIILSENNAIHNEYSKSELFTNEKFRSDLIENITKLSLDVEKIYNFPQYIEGCYAKGKYCIVQTRPQV
jgi:alpha-glucan,water dikinase